MGGATVLEGAGAMVSATVSIAEAILWGEQQLIIHRANWRLLVSIAEAILWGEQHRFVSLLVGL